MEKPTLVIGMTLAGALLGLSGELLSEHGLRALGVAIFIGALSVLSVWKIISWWVDGASKQWVQIPLRFSQLDDKIDGLAQKLELYITEQREIHKACDFEHHEFGRRLAIVEQRCENFLTHHGFKG